MKLLLSFRHQEKYGHAQVPIGWEENPQLANWVSTQRQEYKLLGKGRSTRLSKDRIKVRYEHGSCSLLVWLEKDFTSVRLTVYLMYGHASKLLNDIGFVWEAQRGGHRRKSSADPPRPDIKSSSPPSNALKSSSPSKRKSAGRASPARMKIPRQVPPTWRMSTAYQNTGTALRSIQYSPEAAPISTQLASIPNENLLTCNDSISAYNSNIISQISLLEQMIAAQEREQLRRNSLIGSLARNAGLDSLLSPTVSESTSGNSSIPLIEHARRMVLERAMAEQDAALHVQRLLAHRRNTGGAQLTPGLMQLLQAQQNLSSIPPAPSPLHNYLPFGATANNINPGQMSLSDFLSMQGDLGGSLEARVNGAARNLATGLFNVFPQAGIIENQKLSAGLGRNLVGDRPTLLSSGAGTSQEGLMALSRIQQAPSNRPLDRSLSDRSAANDAPSPEKAGEDTDSSSSDGGLSSGRSKKSPKQKSSSMIDWSERY